MGRWRNGRGFKGEEGGINTHNVQQSRGVVLHSSSPPLPSTSKSGEATWPLGQVGFKGKGVCCVALSES